MKIVSHLLENVKQSLKNLEPVLCEYVNSPFGAVAFPNPTMSTDHKCEYCGGVDHYTPFMMNDTMARSWLCANTDCLVYEATKHKGQYISTIKYTRPLEWAKFCEIYHVGDLYSDIRFEKIQQSKAMIDFMLEFVKLPRSILLMQGSPGSGKTYATLGMCELFTRKNADCFFITQKGMADKWLATTKYEKWDPFVEKITKCAFLCIDDFGTGEISNAFMSFFMELLNTRLQWSNRGTIITTNLDDKKMFAFCGEALNDRIRAGQTFSFKEKTRRKPIF